MSTGKYHFMWQFMRDNDCRRANNISDDVMCTICKGVLIDPCIVICGCRYCLECATKYLDGRKKCCPGKSRYCKEELLDISKLSHPDYAISIKISKLIVACPRYWCDFKGELIQMEKHNRMCGKQPVGCPYSEIGCKEDKLIGDRIDGHLVDGKTLHELMIVKSIDNLQAEVGSMKQEMAQLRAKVTSNMSNKEHIDQLKLMIDKISEQYSTFQSSTKQQLSAIQTSGETQAREIKQLVEKNCHSETRFGQLKRQADTDKGVLLTNIDDVKKKQAKLGEVLPRVVKIETDLKQLTKLGEVLPRVVKIETDLKQLTKFGEVGTVQKKSRSNSVLSTMACVLGVMELANQYNSPY